MSAAMTFYTGAHHPGWLSTSPIPLFLSATTLARYRGRGDAWPVRATSGAPWAGDSGAYAALMLATDGDGHPWSLDGELYGGMWLRIAGHLLASSDSQAWSAVARREHLRLPGCQHLSKPDPEQLALDLWRCAV